MGLVRCKAARVCIPLPFTLRFCRSAALVPPLSPALSRKGRGGVWLLCAG